VGVDPHNSLRLTGLLESWARTEAADVLHLVLFIALGVAIATLLPALLVSGRAPDPATLPVEPAGVEPATFRRPDPPPR